MVADVENLTYSNSSEVNGREAMPPTSKNIAKRGKNEMEHNHNENDNPGKIFHS